MIQPMIMMIRRPRRRKPLKLTPDCLNVNLKPYYNNVRPAGPDRENKKVLLIYENLLAKLGPGSLNIINTYCQYLRLYLLIVKFFLFQNHPT